MRKCNNGGPHACHSIRIFLAGCSSLHHAVGRQRLSNDTSFLTHCPSASIYGVALLCQYELTRNVLSKAFGTGEGFRAIL